MDIVEKTRLLNQWYHAMFHRYCDVLHVWVVRDDEKCMFCDPEKPKCFRVGGKHDAL